MCVYVFGRLFGIVVEFDQKKKSLLERNDKGQGKIFDMFFIKKKIGRLFGIDVEFDKKINKKGLLERNYIEANKEM